MKALLALSADPLTNGHIDVITRASKIFDSLVVAIGINPDKRYTFDINERESLAKAALTHLQNVQVTFFQGLLVDFAKLNNFKVIVRSVRNTPDFDYEKILHDINLSQQQYDIETILLFARQELSHISSSAVKELQKNHGDISKYVPMSIKAALERKISKQSLIGITGGIGSGKSFITRTLLNIFQQQNINAHNIDLDDIGRSILIELDDPFYVSIRRQLIEKIGKHIEVSNFKINIKALTSEMFLNKETLAIFNDVMKEPTIFRLRQLLSDKQGYVFVNSALFAEADLSHLVNNNIICINTDETLRKVRLRDRNYSEEEIISRIASQLTNEERFSILQDHAKNYGKILQFTNNNAYMQEIQNLSNDILNHYKL